MGQLFFIISLYIELFFILKTVISHAEFFNSIPDAGRPFPNNKRKRNEKNKNGSFVKFYF